MSTITDAKKLTSYRESPLKVKDLITGFEGVVTGHADYITGCDQYLVQPPSKEGEFKEPRWFDEHRIEIIEQVKIELKKNNENGADISAPVK